MSDSAVLSRSQSMPHVRSASPDVNSPLVTPSASSRHGRLEDIVPHSIICDNIERRPHDNCDSKHVYRDNEMNPDVDPDRRLKQTPTRTGSDKPGDSGLTSIEDDAHVRDPVIRMLEVRLQEIEQELEKLTIKRNLVAQMLVKLRAGASKRSPASFDELLTSIGHENAFVAKELKLKLSTEDNDSGREQDHQKTRKAYSICQTELEELKHLHTEALTHEGLAKYWYTCPDLQGFECSPNTYTAIRNCLRQWGEDRDHALRVRWLLGDMGMGKTCICRSFALDLESSGLPVAGYFLHGKHKTLSFLLKAIAFGLTQWDREYSVDVEALANWHKHKLEDSVQTLRGKLMEIPSERRFRMLVIIDGIDSCAEAEIKGLLGIISELSAPHIPIAWLISSCYTATLAIAFSSLKGRFHRNFIIDLNKSDADNGISEYTQTRLLETFNEHQLLEHLDLIPSVTKFLVENSDGQFSYIETLLRCTPPSELLLLPNGDSATLAGVFKPIDDKYKSLFNVILPSRSSTTRSRSLNDDKGSAFINGLSSGITDLIHQNPLQVILYHILYLGLPNRVDVIIKFWGISPHILQRVTEPLYPVLRIPGFPDSPKAATTEQDLGISLNLASFRTFLTSPERSGEHAILRSNFDLLAIRQSIRHVNIDAYVIPAEPKAQEMYHLWVALAQYIAGDAKHMKKSVRTELEQALKELNHKAWSKIRKRLASPPDQSDTVLRLVLGRFYKFYATLNDTKGPT